VAYLVLVRRLLAYHMKFRTALFWLAAFSIFICAAQAVEHLLQARGTKAVLSIMRPDDQGIERVQDTLRAHYRAVEGSIAVIAAQGILIFLLIRGERERPVV
jgi:hypothetical protein